MKKTYRLAYNWLEEWHTALRKLEKTQSDPHQFWIDLSRDFGAEPSGLTELELELYRSLMQGNFKYLELLYIEMQQRK